MWVLDPLPLLAALGRALAAGDGVPELAARFHASIARTAADVIILAGREHGVRTVALGGGTFQNARLLSAVCEHLEAWGFRVLVPRMLGPNDGAISYGQAAVAAAILQQEG